MIIPHSALRTPHFALEGDSALRILILEDVPTDAELMERELRKNGFAFSLRRVETREGFIQELEGFAPDLILADYKLPDFDGLSALKIAKEKSPDVPFIFVTGVMGEEWAVETIKKGATDYVLKDRIFRLTPAVKRAIEEAHLRTERKKAEEAVKCERDKFIKVFEAMDDGVYIVDQNYDIEYINPVLEREFGQWKGIKCYTYFHDRTEVCPWCPNQRVFAGEKVRWEWTSLKNGKTYDLLDTPLIQPDGSIRKLEIFRDITDKKKAEEELAKHVDELERYMKATVQREFRIKELRDQVEELEKRLKG